MNPDRRFSFGNRAGVYGSCAMIELTGIGNLFFFVRGGFFDKGVQFSLSGEQKRTLEDCIVHRLLKFAYTKFFFYRTAPNLYYVDYASADCWEPLKRNGFQIIELGRSPHETFRLRMAVWAPPDKPLYRLRSNYAPKDIHASRS
jgi:hypothetical protein